MSLDETVKQLQEDVTHLKSEMFTLSKNQNSRRGPEGARGGVGPVGPSGHDAVLIVKTDTKENVVRVLDENGTEKAAIVAVPGKPGRDGVSPPPAKDGANGRDGVSPSIGDIVKLVLAELKAHWARL